MTPTTWEKFILFYFFILWLLVFHFLTFFISIYLFMPKTPTLLYSLEGIQKFLGFKRRKKKVEKKYKNWEIKKKLYIFCVYKIT